MFNISIYLLIINIDTLTMRSLLLWFTFVQLFMGDQRVLAKLVIGITIIFGEWLGETFIILIKWKYVITINVQYIYLSVNNQHWHFNNEVSVYFPTYFQNKKLSLREAFKTHNRGKFGPLKKLKIPKQGLGCKFE